MRVLALAALLLGVGAPGGTAANRPSAPILGIVPPAGASRHLGEFGPAAPSGPLVLQNQPCLLSNSPPLCWTMRTNTTYAIYWVPSGFSVDANYETLINRYFGDVAAASDSLTNVYSVAMQYYDSSAAIQYHSTFGGSYVDTNPFPASGCSAAPTCLTDQQIQDEIQNVLTAKGWQAGPTTMFFLMTPDGVASCTGGGGGTGLIGGGGCSTNAYCAYHSGFQDSSFEPVVYANEPYDAANPHCWDGTSPNGDDADATINAISHEHNEAITDPWGDAWRSAAGEEVADLCAWNFGTPLGGTVGADAYNQVINGHHYWLQTEYSNDPVGNTSCLQQYTPTVPPSIFTEPVLSGAAGQGQFLSTTDGSWQHAPIGYAYKWQRCGADGDGCADIAGATASTYRLASTDVGHTLRAEVSGHNAAGSAPYVATSETAVVVPALSVIAAPALSGVAAVHRKLRTTDGSWNTSPVSVTYQWLRCAADGGGCTAIPHATAAAHTLVAADAGHTLEARVSVTNAAGTAAALSNRSGVVLGVPAVTAMPRISGPARVGSRLSGSRGSWTNSPTSYRYQWLRCNAHGRSCASVRHATHPTYRLTSHDAGLRLRLRVIATNAADSKTATSAPSARVAH